MKVLLLHQFYNTPQQGGALRSYYLARALADTGITPIVISTHNRAEIKVAFDEGIEVHYLPVLYDNRYGFFKRVYSYLKFVWSIVRYAGKFRDADYCYAISTPLTTGLAAIWIKYRYSTPYFFEVGDLWPEAPIQLGFIRNPFLKFILYRLERLIYKKSEAVVALSPPIKKSIEEKVPGKLVHLIPNMADTDFFVPQVKEKSLENKFQVLGKFVVSYIGTLGVANGLEFILECAALCKKQNLGVQFLICGNGAMKAMLMDQTNRKNLDNVSFIASQNREGVKEIMNITDAVMVCYKPLPVLETGSPNKFFDGLAAGKLIILNVKGWLAEEVQVHQCGFSVDPQHPDELIAKLKNFSRHPQKLQTFQQSSRKLAETKYARKIINQSFTKLFIKP